MQMLPTSLEQQHRSVFCPLAYSVMEEFDQGLNEVTGELIAVKVLPLPDTEQDIIALHQELSFMQQFVHQNIVSYLGAEICENTNQLYIFQQWVPGGSISSLLHVFGAFSEDVVRRYTRQVLQGLAHLHNHQIVHRDIKGSNILDRTVLHLLCLRAPLIRRAKDP
eukprot:6948-Heterococcus_DN1.PRE.9